MVRLKQFWGVVHPFWILRTSCRYSVVTRCSDVILSVVPLGYNGNTQSLRGSSVLNGEAY